MSNRRFALLVALLCVPLVWGIVRHSKDPFNLTLLARHRGGLEAVHSAAQIALAQMTARTVFEHHWAINPLATSPGDLRLELFRSDPETRADRTTDRYTDNCQYVGRNALIICDVRLFEYFMHRWGLDRQRDTGGKDWPTDVPFPVVARSPAEQAKDLEALVTWIVGHELGHVLSGQAGQFADTAGLLSQVPATRMLQRQELAADEFLIQHTTVSSTERMFLVGFLTDALNTELRLKYCPTVDVMQNCPGLPYGMGIIYDYAHQRSLPIDPTESHPEFLVRLVRLSQLHHAQIGCDTDALCKMLSDVAASMNAIHR